MVSIIVSNFVKGLKWIKSCLGPLTYGVRSLRTTSKLSHSPLRNNFQSYLNMMLKYHGLLDIPFDITPKELTTFSMHFNHLSYHLAEFILKCGRQENREKLFLRRKRSGLKPKQEEWLPLKRITGSLFFPRILGMFLTKCMQ